MPLQVLCYERADDIAAGVSGVVTRAQGIRASFPGSEPCRNPHGRRRQPGARPLSPRSHRRQPPLLALAHSAMLFFASWVSCRPRRPRLRTALDPSLPPQARRPGSLHRPIQPVGRLATDGQRPGADLARHSSQRTADSTARQKLKASASPIRASKAGAPDRRFMPGMDVRAPLTVVGDGPVGQSARHSTRSSACPKATPAASGHWA